MDFWNVLAFRCMCNGIFVVAHGYFMTDKIKCVQFIKCECAKCACVCERVGG